MKLRIEIAEGLPEEVVLRGSEVTPAIKKLQSALEAAMLSTEMPLSLANTDYFIPTSTILFFETQDGKVTAHTRDRMYYSSEKLFELESKLPRQFVRVSKSCIVNAMEVESISKSLTGTGEARFSGSDKIAYVSRMYCKILKDTIYEMRIAK